MGRCYKTMPIIPLLPRKQELIKGTWVREKQHNSYRGKLWLHETKQQGIQDMHKEDVVAGDYKDRQC